MWSVCCLEDLLDTISGLYGVSLVLRICLIQCLGYMEYPLSIGYNVLVI